MHFAPGPSAEGFKGDGDPLSAGAGAQTAAGAGAEDRVADAGDQVAGAGGERIADLGDQTVTAGSRTAQRAARAAEQLQWLAELWRASGAPDEGMALACTGSLARGECGPASDLDLVVLHETRSDKDQQRVAQVADSIWYPIWDRGLSLDHSVRSVKQCRQVASDDLSVAGAMLDLRPIAGDAELVRRGVRHLAEDWRMNARRRLPELVAGVRARHHIFGDLAQLLEPELKEARGGLRDMSVLRTLTASWLADRPHGAVDESYSFLLDVRDALQEVTGRPRNLLTMADQDDVAERLGLGETTEPADELLALVARAGRRISAAVEATARRAGQSQRARIVRRGPRRPDLTWLVPGIYSHDQEVVLGPVRGGPAPEPSEPPLLVAAIAGERELPLAPATVRHLTGCPAPPRPWPASTRELLIRLLASPGLLATFNTLDLAGLTTAWIPDWEQIRDRPQRNALHRHTVDRHSLEVVRQMQPLCADLDRPDLALLAALLHDIGKLPGEHDHSAVGAPLARRTVAGLGLDDADADRIELLVAEHLSLMALATTRDLADPATAAELAERVHHDRSNLRLLAALTEADARAAGATADQRGTWTSGRAALVRELVARTEVLLA